jgi:hypothetical protein
VHNERQESSRPFWRWLPLIRLSRSLESDYEAHAGRMYFVGLDLACGEVNRTALQLWTDLADLRPSVRQPGTTTSFAALEPYVR